MAGLDKPVMHGTLAGAGTRLRLTERFAGRFVTRADDIAVRIANTAGMIEGVMLLPVVLPALFWAGYHYHKDRHLPEPPVNLLACVALGVVAAWLSRGLYLSLEVVGLRYDAVALAKDHPAGLFAYAVLVIGPVEELSKLLPFLLVVRRFRSFDEPLDGMIFASFIALGYAAAENLYYLQFLTPLEAAARGFAGPVVHILFASIWGHWIGVAHVAGRSIVFSTFASVLIASVLHGIYDFVVLLQPVGALPVAALLVVAIWLWRLRLMRLLHLAAVTARSPHPDKRAHDAARRRESR